MPKPRRLQRSVRAHQHTRTARHRFVRLPDCLPARSRGKLVGSNQCCWFVIADRLKKAD